MHYSTARTLGAKEMRVVSLSGSQYAAIILRKQQVINWPKDTDFSYVLAVLNCLVNAEPHLPSSNRTQGPLRT